MKKPKRLTDKDRLSIFIQGYQLENFQGVWWIARREADGSKTLMLGDSTEAGPLQGYFNSATKAIDSFLRESRRTAVLARSERRAEKKGRGSR